MADKGFEWQDDTGSGGFSLSDPAGIQSEITKIAAGLIKAIQVKGREKGVVDSGDMLSGDSFSFKDFAGHDGVGIELFMMEYADYVNKGVKGWGSSANAPASPYQYKSKGMSADGRKSIMASIQRGTMKLTNVNQNYKIGLEKKYKQGGPKKSILEKQADKIAYLIKRFGIKRTGFIDEAVFENFKDFDVRVVDSLMNQFYISLIKK